MNTNKDYYQVLGVPRDAGEDEVKRAYRRLAMQFHPDRNLGNEKWANEKFKEINEAFSVVGDPVKRRQYDQFGTAQQADAGDIFNNPHTRVTFDEFLRDMDGAGLRIDFLNEIFGEALRGSYSGRGRFGSIRFEVPGDVGLEELLRRSGMAAEPARYELTITAAEAKKGTRKVLVRNGKRVEIKVPAVKSNSVLKLKGALESTDNRPGDILIRVKVRRR